MPAVHVAGELATGSAHAKKRHFSLDDDSLTLKLTGRRGKTAKGSVDLLSLVAPLQSGKTSDGARDGTSFTVTTEDGKRLTISADNSLLAALRERMRSRTMRALAFGRHGSPQEVMKLTRVLLPSAVPPSFVLVRVHAAALNPIDKLRIEGGLKALRPEAAWPVKIGYDLAGVVEKVGEDAYGFAVGDAVAARMQSGVYSGAVAQFALVHVATLAKKPAAVSFTDAASLGLAGETALQALRRGGAGPGKKVFITGGAGGVGTLAIQIAKLLGSATVATTASAGEKAELCASLGADVVVDYTSRRFEDELRGYDVVLDTTNESARCGAVVRDGAHVVTIAGTPTVEAVHEAGLQPNFIVRHVLNKKRNVAAEQAAKRAGAQWSYLFLKPSGADLATLLSWVKEGKLKPVLDGVWPFEEAAAAAARCFSGRAKGKCVVTCAEC